VSSGSTLTATASSVRSLLRASDSSGTSSEACANPSHSVPRRPSAANANPLRLSSPPPPAAAVDQPARRQRVHASERR
jgi:hypothetical protein